MKNLLITTFCCFSSLFSFSQFYINGADIYHGLNSTSVINTNTLIENDSKLIQLGDMYFNNELEINSGLLSNTGNLYCNSDVIINDSLQALAQSNVFVSGNWINNANFISNETEVIFNGNSQLIMGSVKSDFYDLTLTNPGVVELQSVDASINNILNLGDKELSTNSNVVYINSTDINAITRSEGFVSSNFNGKLERNTNSTDPYLFPLGSRSETIYYRPLLISPKDNLSTYYGACMLKYSPSNNGLNADQLDSLCLINEEFYHQIFGVELADIDYIFNSEIDGKWTSLAKWNSEWNPTPSILSSEDTIRLNNWSFASNDLVLSHNLPVLDIGEDIYFIYVSDKNSTQINPIYESQLQGSFSWYPDYLVDNDSALNVNVSFPDELTFLELTVNENDLCFITDTVRVFFSTDLLLVPNSFTPNGDLQNDVFKPENDNIENYYIKIYNQWGQLMYQSDDYETGWDGTFKGKDLPIGAYVYDIDYKLKQQRRKTERGTVTLIK